jgi:hypothetical protein
MRADFKRAFYVRLLLTTCGKDIPFYYSAQHPLSIPDLNPPAQFAGFSNARDSDNHRR